MSRLPGIFILDPETLDLVYGPAERRDIGQYVRWVAEPQTRTSIAHNSNLLSDVEVIFSGWGAPTFDDTLLDLTPNLRAIFHAAGPLNAPAALARGIAITTSHHANSIPVAEFTMAAIIFSLKHAWRLAHETRTTRTHTPRNGVPGCYRSTVGLIGVGMIARLLLRLLEPMHLRVVAHDPYLSPHEAMKLGIELVSLETLFEISDAVSLHVPHTPATVGLIHGHHLSRMKPGAAFINTARGAVVNEPELIQIAIQRPDLQLVLDVTYPEPAEPDSPLYTLPNVFLTSHIAGSAGGECRRLGRYMVEELERFVTGRPLQWAIHPVTMPTTLSASHGSRAATPIATI